MLIFYLMYTKIVLIGKNKPCYNKGRKKGDFMKIEEGTIIAIKEAGSAEIKVGRHSDCIACGACDGADNIVVTAVDPLGVKVGQHVRFEFRDVNIVIGAFICFVMPLLVCAAGAFCRPFPGLVPRL